MTTAIEDAGYWTGQALDTDWVARGVAIASFVVAFASLGWQIYSWRRQGPTIKVRATCTGRGDGMKIAGSVRNRGRFDAEIVRATFSWLATASQGYLGAQTPRLSSDLPDGHIRGMTLPTPLAAETGKEFTVVDLRGVDLGLAVALHDRRPASLTFHTAAGRTAKATIKYAKS